MGSTTTSSNNDFVADINVTPFVDVMLVLLIIFMITAPALASGLEVKLPVTKASAAMQNKRDDITLTLNKDNGIYLDNRKIELSALAPALQDMQAQEKRLLLKADETVPYGVVMQIMREMKACGITNVGACFRNRQSISVNTF